MRLKTPCVRACASLAVVHGSVIMIASAALPCFRPMTKVNGDRDSQDHLDRGLPKLEFIVEDCGYSAERRHYSEGVAESMPLSMDHGNHAGWR